MKPGCRGRGPSRQNLRPALRRNAVLPSARYGNFRRDCLLPDLVGDEVAQAVDWVDVCGLRDPGRPPFVAVQVNDDPEFRMTPLDAERRAWNCFDSVLAGRAGEDGET